jgi:K+-transporting ATPase ATPase C chain
LIEKEFTMSNMTTSTIQGQAAGVLRPALVLFLALSILTGLLYPFAVTGVAQVAFEDAAQGSLIQRGGQALGSRLIGQSFTSRTHFWGRPSATGPAPYNAAASGGSNLGPSNPALIEAVRARLAALKAADPGNIGPVPVDLVTASGSGLDPHISKAAADHQVARVARANGLPQPDVQTLVDQHAEGRWLGFLGEPRVNVLELNLAMDKLAAAK